MSVRKFAWLLLFVWAVVCSACSVDGVVETSPVDQDSSVNVVTRTSVPEVSTTETATTIISSIVTTAVAMLDLSPAWIEAKELLQRPDITELSDDEFRAEHVAYSRFYNQYIRENTNSISSSPIGALCWIVQELSRTHELYLGRILADELAKVIMNLLRIVDENYNNQRPIEFLLDYLTEDITVEDSGDSGPVGVVAEDNDVAPGMLDSDNSLEDDELSIEEFLTIYRDPEMIDFLRVTQEGGGDGTEWASAVRSVVRPEVRAAIGAGEGLPPDIQSYADALFRAVQDYIDSGQTEPYDFYQYLPGFHNFVEAAKYSPDCKRLSIALDELRTENDTSTSVPVTAHTDFTVLSGVPTIATSDFATTTTLASSVDDRPFSQAWIESASSLGKVDGLLEDAPVQEEYWLNNPNTLSSPMGAFCWAYHEIFRAMWRLLMFDDLASHFQWLMDELDITVAQVGEAGPDRNTAVLDILSGVSNQDPAPVGSVEGGDTQTDTTEPGQDMTDEKLARLLFYSDEDIEYYRIRNRIGGDGTEWYDALRAVADPKIIEATRSGAGLPTVVQPYADRFFETVNKLSVDTRPVTDDYYAADFIGAFDEEIPLPADLVAFLEEAKYSQDCKRLYLTALDYL